MRRSGDQTQATGDGSVINAGKCHYHILISRNHFYLNHALILVLEKKGGQIYRLVVYHNGQFLKDILYLSLRGAKIAFKKYFKKRAYSEEVEAEWSETDGDLNELSPPLPQLPSLKLFESSEKKWLENILNGQRR